MKRMLNNRLTILLLVVLVSISSYSTEKYELCYNIAGTCNNDCFYHLNNNYLLQYNGGVTSDKFEILITNSEDSVAYNSLGSYKLEFGMADSVSDYSRVLHMDKGISAITYKQGAVTYKREVFSDFDKNRIIFHIESSEKGGVLFVITSSNGVNLDQLKLIESDGRFRQLPDSFIVSAASDVTIGIQLDNVATAKPEETYNQIKKKHVSTFEDVYGKFFFQLDKDSNHKDIERLFQYSRYVAVSSELSVSSHPQFFVPTTDSIFSNEIKLESYMDLRKFVDYSTYIKDKLVALSGDAIGILPDLPSDWAKKGRVVGAQMPGGFVIDLVWRDDKIKTLVVRSNEGGNCRLKVKKEIDGCKCLGMEPANGVNPNPFYQNMSETGIGIQLLSSSKIFDFETYPGQVAVFSGK